MFPSARTHCNDLYVGGGALDAPIKIIWQQKRDIEGAVPYEKFCGNSEYTIQNPSRLSNTTRQIARRYLEQQYRYVNATFWSPESYDY